MFKPRAVITSVKRPLSVDAGPTGAEGHSSEVHTTKKPRNKWGPPVMMDINDSSDAAIPSIDAGWAASSNSHHIQSEPLVADSCNDVEAKKQEEEVHKTKIITKGVRGRFAISLSSTNLNELSARVDSKSPGSVDVAAKDGKTDTIEPTDLDGKGYFRGGISHVICDRYRVMASLGKGVFASVFRCIDMHSGEDVALKVLRTTAIKSGERERNTLRRLHAEHHHSQRGKNFIIRILDDFEYSGHVIIVLERMHTSVRELCKLTLCRHGAFVSSNHYGLPGGGLRPRVVLSFTRQMLEALNHIHSLEYVHLDLKPDNILVNQDCSHFKICDFGTTKDMTKEEESLSIDPGEYFAARFYRSPEIALAYGQLSPAADIWSLGITIAEMCGGRPVFKGRNNNELVWNIMSTLGPISKVMATSCKKNDNAAGPVVRIMPRPDRASAAAKLLALMSPPSLGPSSNSASGYGKDRKALLALRDILLNKMLALDPANRLPAHRMLGEDVIIAAMDHAVPKL